MKLAHYIRNRWPQIYLIIAASDLPKEARSFPKPYDDGTNIAEMIRMFAALQGAEPGKL